MTRKRALRAVAASSSPSELRAFADHPNKHVRHAARFKAWRLDPENDTAVAECIRTCRDYLSDREKWASEREAYEAAVVEHAALVASLSEGDEEPKAPYLRKEPERPCASNWWTALAAAGAV